MCGLATGLGGGSRTSSHVCEVIFSLFSAQGANRCNIRLCCVRGVGDLLFLPAHGSQLLSGTSQRTFVGLACGTQSPLRVTPQRGHLFLRESCRSRGSGCDAPEGALAPGSGRLLGHWENLIPQPLRRTHVFENLLGRQDLLIFSTSCD